MKKPKCLKILLMSLFCLVNEAQTIYTYNGVYRIELPDKLELQDSELNNVKQIGTKGQKTQSGKIVFQQKGLNDDVCHSPVP